MVPIVISHDRDDTGYDMAHDAIKYSTLILVTILYTILVIIVF